MDSYGFLLAGFLVTMGTLGDRIGHRRLLLAGAAAFSVASVLAAYSSSAEMLIVTRAVMGVAGATLMPWTLALITTMFRDAHQRSMAIAVWMSCFMGGMSVGPLVGGVLLASFWWGSVFLLGVPVMLVLLLTAPLLLPEYRDDDAGRLDLTSVALSLATVLPVIYGVKETAQHGLAPGPVVAVVAGLGFGTVFVRRQLRLRDPLFEIRLFRNRPFSAALAINLGGGVVVATNLTPHLAKRFPAPQLMAAGLVVAAAGLLLLTRVGSEGAVPPEKAARPRGSRRRRASSESRSGSRRSAVWPARCTAPSSSRPQRCRAGWPSRPGRASPAPSAAAGAVPADVAVALLASARDAFTAGLNLAGAVGAGLFVVMAAVALVVLRDRGHTSAAGDATVERDAAV